MISEIQEILSKLEGSEKEFSRAEMIEGLVPKFGWDAIHDYLIELLSDDKTSMDSREVIAQVFWGAALDGLKIESNKLIALLYTKLPNNQNSSENNLAWSIVCKLKKVNYLSDYKPLLDPEIMIEIQKLTTNKEK